MNEKEKLDAVISEFRSKQKELKETVQNNFGAAAKYFFEKYPDLKSFGWVQYMNYFSDGDENTFSAYTDTYSLEINGESDGESDGEQSNDLDRAAEEISKFLGSIGEDLLKEIFGDHKSITVTKDGVEISSYERVAKR